MGDCSDLDRQIEQLRRCEVIKECEVKSLCAKASIISTSLLEVFIRLYKKLSLLKVIIELTSNQMTSKEFRFTPVLVMLVKMLKQECDEFDHKVRKALEIQLQDTIPCSEHGLNLDDGQYVTMKFWRPMFTYLRLKSLQ